MKKNILIANLSDINPNREYPELCYTSYLCEKPITSCYTNETGVRAVLDFLTKKNTSLDGLFFFCTHTAKNSGILEKLQERIPHLPPIELIEIDDNEDAPQMLHTLTKVLNRITSIFSEEDEIFAHIDPTSGKRNTSMLMLALMQLLEYHNIHIATVLYTDFLANSICDAKPLVETYKLISGAEEFINYGFSTQLSTFYRKNKSLKLRTVLQSMEEFSGCLKVCASMEVMQTALRSLQEAIQAFHESDSTEEVFKKVLLPRIEREYQDLFLAANSNNPRTLYGPIIQWTLQKGLLQQGITFYAEWTYDYLYHEVIQIKNKKFKDGFLQFLNEDTQVSSPYSSARNFLRGYLPEWLRRYNRNIPKQNCLEKYAFSQAVKQGCIGLNDGYETGKIADFIEGFIKFTHIRNKINHAIHQTDPNKATKDNSEKTNQILSNLKRLNF